MKWIITFCLLAFCSAVQAQDSPDDGIDVIGEVKQLRKDVDRLHNAVNMLTEAINGLTKPNMGVVQGRSNVNPLSIENDPRNYKGVMWLIDPGTKRLAPYDMIFTEKMVHGHKVISVLWTAEHGYYPQSLTISDGADFPEQPEQPVTPSAPAPAAPGT